MYKINPFYDITLEIRDVENICFGAFTIVTQYDPVTYIFYTN